MEQPDKQTISKVYAWAGSHTSEKKYAMSKKNMAKAREVRKQMQAAGIKVGGWPKGVKRDGRMGKKKEEA